MHSQTPYLGPNTRAQNVNRVLSAAPSRRPVRIQNDKSQLQMSILGRKNRNTTKIDLDDFVTTPKKLVDSVSRSYSEAIRGDSAKKQSVKSMFFDQQITSAPFSSRPVRNTSAIPSDLRHIFVPSQDESSSSSSLSEEDTEMIEVNPADILARNNGEDITAPPISMEGSTSSVFDANEYSAEHSQESWLRYSGRVPERVRKVQQLLTAKAGSLKSTLMCKMNNGNSGGVTPLQFGKNIFACISRMKYTNDRGEDIPFKAGVDYQVFHQAVSGIAEIYAPDEYIREKLTSTYKFPYHKLVTDERGRPAFGPQEGVFFITQLRQPKQLYDIVGVDYELSTQFDKPLKDLFTRLLPQGANITVNNVNMYNDALNEDGDWIKISVPGPKRVTVECPAGEDTEIPDGPMVLNIPTLGQRVVHTELKRTTNLCHLCGGPYNQCRRKCQERCRNCGMAFTEGHSSEESCQHKDKANTRFALNNITIERNARMDKQLFSDPIDDSLDNEKLKDILVKRRDINSFQKDIFKEQARIAALAMVPAEMRTDLDYHLSSDTEDVTYMANIRATELDKTYSRKKTAFIRKKEERRARDEHIPIPARSEEEAAQYNAGLDDAITALFKTETAAITDMETTTVTANNKRPHEQVDSATDSSDDHNLSKKSHSTPVTDNEDTDDSSWAEQVDSAQLNPIVHDVPTQLSLAQQIISTVDDDDIIKKSPPELLSWLRELKLDDNYIGNEMVALSLIFLTELGLDEMIREVAEDFTTTLLDNMKTLCPERDDNTPADAKIGPDNRVYDDYDKIELTENWGKMLNKLKGHTTIPDFRNRKTNEVRPVNLIITSSTNAKDYRSVLRDIFNIYPPRPWALQRDHFDRSDERRVAVLKWSE